MTDTDSLLMAYVDGELDAAAAAAVERLLASDPAARRTVDIYRSTTALLRAACAEGVYADAAPAPAAAPRRRLLPRRAALAVAASVAALAIGFTSGYLAPRPDDGFIDDVVEYHTFYSQETTHLAEIPADRPDEIADWLGGRLHMRLVPPDLTADGLRFAGGRLLSSGGAPLADLLYTRAHGPPVALCIMPSDQRQRAATPVAVSLHEGLRVAAWEAGGYSFAVVGDLSAPDIRTLANRAAAQLGI